MPAAELPRKGSNPGAVHDGLCGTRRGRCWRAECRDQFGDYASVEYGDGYGGFVRALCHGETYRPVAFELRAELWKWAS